MLNISLSFKNITSLEIDFLKLWLLWIQFQWTFPSQYNNIVFLYNFKGWIRYIFASLFYISKKEHFSNKRKYFLFLFESSFCSWDNQILTFQIFKCHDVIKCFITSLVMKLGQFMKHFKINFFIKKI